MGDLIEQLGGYENVIKHFKHHDYIPDMKIFIGEWFGFYSMQELRQALLEYRRQHNIYEVGDKVCCRGGIKQNPFWDLNSIFTIKEIWDSEIDLITSDDDLGCFPVRPHQIGHATDAEIKAGHRL